MTAAAGESTRREKLTRGGVGYMRCCILTKLVDTGKAIPGSLRRVVSLFILPKSKNKTKV